MSDGVVHCRKRHHSGSRGRNSSKKAVGVGQGVGISFAAVAGIIANTVVDNTVAVAGRRRCCSVLVLIILVVVVVAVVAAVSVPVKTSTAIMVMLLGSVSCMDSIAPSGIKLLKCNP